MYSPDPQRALLKKDPKKYQGGGDEDEEGEN